MREPRPHRLSRLVPRSLRARITLAATAGVLLVLSGASTALVHGIRGTLIGQTQAAADLRVSVVAERVAEDGVAAAVEHSVPAPVRRGDAPRQVGGPPVGVIVRGPDGTVTATQDSVLFMRTPQRELLERIDQAYLAAAGPPGAGDEVVATRRVTTPDGTYTVVGISPLAEISRSVAAVTQAMVIATPLVTILLGILCWVAVGRALRPVDQLRQRADVISHTDLDERLPIARTGDEIERLTITLNGMLCRLAGALRRQREFVSDTAHELRTPLATMRTELEVALAHHDDAGWRTTAEALLADQARLARLAHDLLVLARLDEHVGLRDDAVRLDEVVAGETTALPDDAVDLQPVTVRGDHDALARAVRNLVDNAARHATARVLVEVSGGHGHAVVRVDDDGPGVPADQRVRVFERFARADEARARTDGGTGIGLAIVRRAAEVHGGTVTIGDAPIGGARFELHLPLACTRRDPRPAPA